MLIEASTPSRTRFLPLSHFGENKGELARSHRLDCPFSPLRCGKSSSAAADTAAAA